MKLANLNMHSYTIAYHITYVI